MLIVPTASAAKALSAQGRGAGRGPLDRGRRAAPALCARPRRRRRRRSPAALAGATRRQRRLAGRRHRPRRHGARALPTSSREPRRRQALRWSETRPGQEALGAVGRRRHRRPPRCAGAARRGRPRATASLHAMSARGQRLGEAPFTFGAGETRALATFDLPLELRNQVTRVEIAGERSAGAVTCSMPARSGTASASSRAPRASRRSRCWRRSTTSSGRCSRSRRSPRAKTPISPPSSTALIKRNVSRADAGRHRHAAARHQGAGRAVGEEGRRARALRRPAAGEGRRRSAARALAARRPHAGRRAVLGDAAAAGALRRRQPVRRPARRRRRCWSTAGAGRSGRARPRGESVGAPEGRHAARHRGASAATAR